MANKNKDPSEILSQLERMSAYATLVIILGIIGEIGGVLVFGHPGMSTYEKALAILSNMFVLAGLAVEYYCIKQTIIAPEEIQRRSSERVANAERDARIATLETERLRAQFAWRRLSQEQIELIRKSFSEYVAPCRIFTTAITSDPEAVAYKNDITAALQAAGVAVLSTSFIKAGGDPTEGIEIHGFEHDPEEVRNRFKQAGIETRIGEPMQVRELQIFVGYKPYNR